MCILKIGGCMKRKNIVQLIGLVLLIGFIFFIGRLDDSKLSSTDYAKKDFNAKEAAIKQDEKDSEIQTGERDSCEILTKDEKGIPVCDIVKAMDFTVNESHLSITPEEEQVYLERYLGVLKNEIPIIDGVETKYYRDLWKAGIEYKKLLEEKETRKYPYLYYYDDLDGDGKPEFAIVQGCMFLFKYEKDLDQCKVVYFEESDYFEAVVGVGKIWCHDELHANVIRDDLLGLDADGSFQYIIRLEEGTNSQKPYFMVGISDVALRYVEESREEWNKIPAPFFEYAIVSEREWSDITTPFFEMIENKAISRKTLEEVFGDLLVQDALD